jgi:hypothetical protein
MGPSLDTGCAGPSHVPHWEAHHVRDFGPQPTAHGTQGIDLDKTRFP